VDQPRRRKLLRRHSAPAAAPVASEVSDVADASDSVPLSISNVLMVEVENVAHDPYKTTEEMKVVNARSETLMQVGIRWSCCIWPRGNGCLLLFFQEYLQKCITQGIQRWSAKSW